MVMKRNAMRTNLLRSIFRSLGRYIAIALIIALGAAIFVGLRMTRADMVATGQVYTDQQNMFDLRLVNSYGWSHNQLDEIQAVAQDVGAQDVEGVFYQDLIAVLSNSETNAVYRFYTIPETINLPVLLEGRMPEKPNECLADGYVTDDSILGTKVTISQENEEDTLETVLERELTVVGVISSPLYMDMNRGTTSVGNGIITDYFQVMPEVFDVDYYTEIHVTIPGDYKIYTDDYNDAMESLAETLETRLWSHAQNRFRRVQREAENAYQDGLVEYEDGLQEYLDGKAEAEQELADAYQELLDGEQEIQDSEILLRESEWAIQAGKNELLDAERALEDAVADLEAGRTSGYAALEASKAELDQNATSLNGYLATINANLTSINSQIAALDGQIAPLEGQIAALDAQIAPLQSNMNAADTAIQSLQAQLDAADPADTALIADLQSQIQAQTAVRDDCAAQITSLESQKAQYTGPLQELYNQKSPLVSQQTQMQNYKNMLQSQLSQVEAGYAQLEQERQNMEQQLAAAEAEIQAASAQIGASWAGIADSERQIADGWVELEEGRQELADGWIEYEDAKLEVEQELADAEQELADARVDLEDARETIDSMSGPNLYVLDRNSNVGYSSLNSSSDIVEGIAKVLPAFFLLIAALVCITTMTRMVDEERTQIGTLKALGYSNIAIIGKYLMYAGSSALLGCGLGVAAGSVIFPRVLWEAYKMLLFIQDDIVITFNPVLSLSVVAVYIAVELAVTWYCCYRTLEEVPAELIRPKAPSVAKPLIFERMKLWNRVSFLNKVTIRNIFRYRQRLAMMIVGIGGCTALLLTGFGLRDSIVNIVDFQFQDITTYDMSVYFTEGRSPEEQALFLEELATYTESAMFYHQTSVEIDNGEMTKEIYMVSAGEGITEFIDFHQGKEPLALPEAGEMLLSVGVAEMMGVQTGDVVEIRDADRNSMELTVSGLYDNHVYNYCIISPETIQDIWGREPEQQMAFVKLLPDQDPYYVSTVILEMDGVVNVSVSKDLAGMVQSMMQALDLVVWVVVFCAALLGATVLYNLTNININERIREIATIKVLGFNAQETAMYIFKENITLTVFGSAFGLLLGKTLLDFVLTQVKIDMVWFSSRAMLLSYIISIMLTLLTALIVDFVFYFRLETVNMAEALKSVE